LAFLVCGLGVPTRAQTPEPQPAPQPADPEALSASYRFIETYSSTEDPAKPDLLMQYQVASRERVKVTREQAQGAPRHDETVLQVKYTERISKVEKEKIVSEVVRRYDSSSFRTTVDFHPLRPEPFKDLTVLYRLQGGPAPYLLLLKNRQVSQRQAMLTEQQYEAITQESFLPLLSTMFPRQPSRKGDTWPLSRGAAWALLGVPPSDEDYALEADVQEIQSNEAGKGKTAVINVKGRCVVPQGPSAINAIIHFTFVPSAPEPASRERPAVGGEAASDKASTKTAPPANRQPGGVYDARGFVNSVRLAHVVTSPLPGNDGRFKQSVLRELVLERRKLAGTGVAPVEIPNPLPEPTGPTSWLVYDDPQGAFFFFHPQYLKAEELDPTGKVELVDRRPDERDLILLSLEPKSGDPQKDRLAGDPLQEKKLLEDTWKKQGTKIVPGPADYLHDPDWDKRKRKVYRLEYALIKPEEDGTASSDRVYLDRYIVQFNRNEVLKATAMTPRDKGHPAFRAVAEAILKSFDFGPSEGTLPASPTPARPPR
jgi:hypothetical protein